MIWTTLWKTSQRLMIWPHGLRQCQKPHILRHRTRILFLDPQLSAPRCSFTAYNLTTNWRTWTGRELKAESRATVRQLWKNGSSFSKPPPIQVLPMFGQTCCNVVCAFLFGRIEQSREQSKQRENDVSRVKKRYCFPAPVAGVWLKIQTFQLN